MGLAKENGMVWIKGEKRDVDHPEPGFYALRLVRKGPEVASTIECVDGVWRATINGEPDGEDNIDPQIASGVQRVWLWGRYIPESEYRYLLARHRHAVEHDPTSPYANPEKPIDLRAIPVIGGK